MTKEKIENMISQTEHELTGYPSIDKPWLKYYDLNRIGAPLPVWSLFDNIYENNKEHLDNPALVFFEKKISYRNLFTRIDLAEGKLKNLGVKTGDTVSFISILTPEVVAIFYAINRIGAVANFIDPRLSVETSVHHIVSTDSKVLIVLDACADKLNEISKQIGEQNIIWLSISSDMTQPIKTLYRLKTGNKLKMPAECIKYEDITVDEISIWKREKIDVSERLAIICYTGGTSGDSKGVELTNYNINSVCEQFRKLSKDFDRNQKWLTPSVPFIAYFIVCSLHMPLSYGMSAYIEFYEPMRMVKKILKCKINHIAVTPVIYETLCSWKNIKSLEFLIMPTTGGDKLSETTYKNINDFFVEHGCKYKISNGYGMTEVSSGACVSASNECNKSGSVGIPLPDTVITCFDLNSGEECKIGESGELCISGPSLMRGYCNNHEATAAVIKEHNSRRWMHTGDIAHLDEDGCIFVEGRIKRMIIRFDGFKIFPNDIEEKLMKSDKIDNCCCVGIDDGEYKVGQVPVVFYVPHDGYNDNDIEKELRKIASKQISEYSQPAKYLSINEMPRTHAGKIDYRALEKIRI